MSDEIDVHNTLESEAAKKEAIKELGGVPADVLELLVEEWRYEYELPAGAGGHTDVARAYEQCANELEAVMEKYIDE